MWLGVVNSRWDCCSMLVHSRGTRSHLIADLSTIRQSTSKISCSLSIIPQQQEAHCSLTVESLANTGQKPRWPINQEMELLPRTLSKCQFSANWVTYKVRINWQLWSPGKQFLIKETARGLQILSLGSKRPNVTSRDTSAAGGRNGHDLEVCWSEKNRAARNVILRFEIWEPEA